jgi:hypothetical protein
MVEKKNPDYSASAVMLTNPPQVMDLLTKHHRLGDEIEKIQLEIDDAIPRALLDKREGIQKELSETDKSLRQAIDEFGSYQNLDYGEYAVKQRRLTKQYNATLFETFFPEYATAVLKKTVDTVKLGGLVKGGLVSEEGMRRAQVMTEVETIAYIIK